MTKMFATAGLLVLLAATIVTPASAADIYTAPSCHGFVNSGPHKDATGATVAGERCVVEHVNKG